MRTKLLSVALASGVILTGCASTNGTMGTVANNKAVLGALGGALGGAAISKATGGEKQVVMQRLVRHWVLALATICNNKKPN